MNAGMISWRNKVGLEYLHVKQNVRWNISITDKNEHWNISMTSKVSLEYFIRHIKTALITIKWFNNIKDIQQEDTKLKILNSKNVNSIISSLLIMKIEIQMRCFLYRT